MGNFSATVTAWASANKQRMVAARNMAVERVVEYAQSPVGAGGNMPIDTGFLRASIRATNNGSVPLKRSKPEGEGAYSFDPGELTLTLAGASLETSLPSHGLLITPATSNTARVGGQEGLHAAGGPTVAPGRAEASAQLQGAVQGREAAKIYQGGGV